MPIPLWFLCMFQCENCSHVNSHNVGNRSIRKWLWIETEIKRERLYNVVLHTTSKKQGETLAYMQIYNILICKTISMFINDIIGERRYPPTFTTCPLLRENTHIKDTTSRVVLQTLFELFAVLCCWILAASKHLCKSTPKIWSKCQ